MVFIYGFFEIAATFIESYFSFRFNDLFVSPKMQKNKCVIMSVILTVIICSINYIHLFSLSALLIALLFVSITNHVLFKVPLLDTFSITIFFSLCLLLFDFFSMAIMGFFLDNNKFATEVVAVQSGYRCAFLLLSKSLLITAYFAIRKLLCHLKKMKSKNLFFITILGYCGVYYYAKITFEYINFNVIVNWFALFVIILLAFFSLLTYICYRKELEQKRLIEVRNNAITGNYADLEKCYKMNAHLYHDMANHIVVLKNLFEKEKYSETEKYLNSLSDVLSAANYTWTGSDIIDCILNIKKAACEQMHITMVIDADPIDVELNDVIISTIMSNLLDNAIEACQKFKTEIPCIRVAIRHINAMIFVKIQNPVCELPAFEDGTVLTTKNNIDKQHGWGMKSVEAAVNKAEGVFHYSCDKGEFVSVVTLFL